MQLLLLLLLLLLFVLFINIVLPFLVSCPNCIINWDKMYKIYGKIKMIAILILIIKILII